MLKRIYAHNFRCLVNFEMKLDELTLLLGPNGGGKSTVFDLLINIRKLLVDQARVHDIFKDNDFTAWINKKDLAVELDIKGSAGLFSYRLVISENTEVKKNCVGYEHLLLDGNMLFKFENGVKHLYTNGNIESSYPFDGTFSALVFSISTSDDNPLIQFVNEIHKIFVLSLNPRTILSDAEEESEWINHDGSNFASWYRFHSQGKVEKFTQLQNQLQTIIPGFHYLKLEPTKKGRLLKVGFTSKDNTIPPIFFEFSQLSDGQRVLIVLYSLLLGLRDLGLTLFIDEPENYLALPEIQPWLMELKDVCGEGFPQAVLISHHPELIDYLGHDCGIILERDPLGPVRVKKLPEIMDSGLKLSELIARGCME